MAELVLGLAVGMRSSVHGVRMSFCPSKQNPVADLDAGTTSDTVRVSVLTGACESLLNWDMSARKEFEMWEQDLYGGYDTYH